jgi:monofunctional biosynthetic peptidoglycan transglycosylase
MAATSPKQFSERVFPKVKRIFLVLLLLLAVWLAFEFLTLPNVADLRDEHPATTAFMELRKKQLEREGKNAALDYRWVAYEKISPYLRRAVLVSEDNEFYEHEGVDVEGLKEALSKDIKRKKLAFGGSTITQQLAKNLYLSPSKNPLRKVKEYIIAKRLERELTKKRILELYLNVVEMGERVYGAEAASRFYFHKSASALNPSEAALLAGCLPNPRVMVPGAPNKRLRARQRIILSRLKRWGYLAEREVLTAKKPKPAEETETTVDTATAVETETAEPTTETTVDSTAESTEEPAPDTPLQPTEVPVEPPTETTAPPPSTSTGG